MEDERLEGAGEVVTPGEGVDTAKPDEGVQEGAADPQKEQQSHEDNRRYQAARQAGERAATDRLMKDVNRKIAALGMRDKSGREIVDIDQLEEYGKAMKLAAMEARAKTENKTMAQIEEEESDKDRLRQIKADEAERAKREKEDAKIREFVAKDAADFRGRYPDVDLKGLTENKAFLRFCGSRYGREPLGDLYEDWTEIAGSAAKTAAAKAESKASRSTGTGGGAGSETLTAEQQQALDEWNRTYPELKMTAKEFLSRR